jgi:MFS family permease
MVEKWGRRPLLMFGAVGMSVCQLIVASVGTALPDQESANKALIAFVCIYIFFFACSWGPCAWVVTGEIFPLKARAKGLSITTASNWLLNWAIAYATPYMVNAGPGNANLGSKVFFSKFSVPTRCSAIIRASSLTSDSLGRILLHLHGLRILLHLRDQGSLSRASR